MSPIAVAEVADSNSNAVGWFSTPQGIAFVGVLTFIGLLLAIWGIVRQAGHGRGTRQGIERATRVLRAAELRTCVAATRGLTSQILALDQGRPKSASSMRTLGQRWLEEQQKVFGLVRDLVGLQELEAFRKAMQAAKIEVTVAIREAREPVSWGQYRFHVLQGKLNRYGEAAEAMLRAADDEVLGGKDRGSTTT